VKKIGRETGIKTTERETISCVRQEAEQLDIEMPSKRKARSAKKREKSKKGS